VAEVSWPAASYNSGAVTEAEYEKLAARFADDGVYWLPAGAAAVTPGAGLQVLVRANLLATVRGFAYDSGPDGVALSIDSNSSGSTRIDRVVLRLDRSTWEVRSAVSKGTPGAGAPVLVRDLWDIGVYEIPLATVTVPSGASSITSGNIAVAPLWVPSRSRVHLTSSRDPGPFPGQINYAVDLDAYERWNGSAWKTVIEDTGWVSLTPNGPNGNAWSNNNISRIRRVNGRCHLRFSIQRWANSGLGTDDADGSAPFTLPAEFRPTADEWGPAFHSRSPVMVRVETSGNVRLYPLVNDIPAGRTVQGSVSWLVG